MTKQLKPGSSYYTEFCTQRFDTGAATDADSLPVITITKNGVDDGTSPSAWDSGIAVSGLDTGRYRVTGTVSTGYIPGDIIDICAEAVVNSVTGKGVIDEFVVISDNVYDSLIGGTDNLEVNSVKIDASGQNLSGIPWNSTWDAEVQSECTDALNAYDPPTNAEMEARTLVATGYATAANQATIAGYIDTEIGSILTAIGNSGEGLSGIPTINSNIISVEGDTTPIDGKSLAAALRYIAAICAGKISGAQTGQETFKGLDGTTTRVVVDVDESGNRTGITYDP